MNRRTLLMIALAPFIPLPKAAITTEEDNWDAFDYEMMPTYGLAWRDPE